MYNAQTEGVVEPRTTGELFKYIGKRLPKQLLKTLPIAIIVAVVSWLVHTYLIVGPNGGFAPDTWLANNVLNVSGKFISSTVLWAMLGGVFTMMLSSIIQKRNPFKTFGEMFKIPGNIVKKNKAMGNALLPVLLVACGVTLLFEKLLSGVAGIVAGGILLSSVASLIMGTGGIFAMLFRMIFNDIQAFVLKKQKTNMDNEAVYMILGASGLTFVVFGLLSSSNIIFRIFGFLGGLAGRILPFFGAVFFFIGTAISVILSWAWAILLLIGIILLLTKKKSVPKTFIFFALFFLSVAAAQKFFGIQIFADDGGWAEAGGTLKGWIGSEGSLQAVVKGVPPAISGVVGANIASIFTGIGVGTTPPDVGGINVADEVIDGGTGQEVINEEKIADPKVETQEEQNQREEYEKEQRTKAEQERKQAEEDHKKEMQRRSDEYDRIKKEKAEAARVKAEQEKIQKIKDEREAYIKRLAKKYNTTPDELRDVLQKNIAKSSAEADKWNKIDNALAVGEAMAVGTVVVADTLIDGMANCGGPGAKAVRAGYKIVKGAASTAADKGLTTENIIGGAVSGGTDAATDFISNPYAKAATTIAGETLSGAITGGADGAKDGFVNGVFKAGTDAVTDKLAGDGYGNEMKTKFNKNGTANVSIKTKSGWVEKNVSGSTAIKFQNNKVAKQLQTSAIKGASGMTNELGAKPVLKDAGVLP